MIVILSGSHGTGKSTLAEKIAEADGLRFIGSSASAIYARHGVSPSVVYAKGQKQMSDEVPFPARMAIQEEIIDTWIVTFLSALKGDDAIFDRSIIDVTAYTLMMSDMGTPIEYRAIVDRCFDKCMEGISELCQATDDGYAINFCIKPFGYAGDRSGKADASFKSFSFAVQGMIEYLNDRYITGIRYVDMLSVSERLKYVRKIIDTTPRYIKERL